MAANIKHIPCRVCGKMFTPCAYCQKHNDVFRWRNFACSEKCARKYINDTIDYRAKSHKENITNDSFVKANDALTATEQSKKTEKRKKSTKISKVNSDDISRNTE